MEHNVDDLLNVSSSKFKIEDMEQVKERSGAGWNVLDINPAGVFSERGLEGCRNIPWGKRSYRYLDIINTLNEDQLPPDRELEEQLQHAEAHKVNDFVDEFVKSFNVTDTLNLIIIGYSAKHIADAVEALHILGISTQINVAVYVMGINE